MRFIDRVEVSFLSDIFLRYRSGFDVTVDLKGFDQLVGSNEVAEGCLISDDQLGSHCSRLCASRCSSASKVRQNIYAYRALVSHRNLDAKLLLYRKFETILRRRKRLVICSMTPSCRSSRRCAVSTFSLAPGEKLRSAKHRADDQTRALNSSQGRIYRTNVSTNIKVWVGHWARSGAS